MIRRTVIISQALLALQFCTTSSTIAADDVIQAQVSQSHLLPAPQTLAYLPLVHHVFTPASLIDSLTQAALAGDHTGTASTSTGDRSPAHQSVGSRAAAVVPRFFANRIVYRPSTQAAQAILHDQALHQDSAQGVHGQMLYKEPGHHPLTDAVTPDESARIASEVARTERQNQLTVEISCAIVQIVRATGEPDCELKNTQLAEAQNRLTELCGQGQAQWAMTKLQDWIAQNKGRIDDLQISPPLSAIELMHTQKALAASAIAADSQVAALRARLGVNNVSPTAPERALSTIALVPIVYTRLASLAQSGVESGSGGSKAQRLAQVLSEGEMLTSRVDLLQQQSSLLMQQNNLARQTGNRVLLGFTEDYASYLSGR